MRLRRGRPVRYPAGFLARYLRHFVLRKRDECDWRQYQVAQWLDLPEQQLSEYLNRHNHPGDEARAQLVRLGCSEEQLLETALADKLFAWARAHDVSLATLERLIRRMHAEAPRVALR